MWLEGIRLQQIDTALEGDRPTNIDQVLADILKGARVQQTVRLPAHPAGATGFVIRCR